MKCTECKGRGSIDLFTSSVRCDACAGSGEVAITITQECVPAYVPGPIRKLTLEEPIEQAYAQLQLYGATEFARRCELLDQIRQASRLPGESVQWYGIGSDIRSGSIEDYVTWCGRNLSTLELEALCDS